MFKSMNRPLNQCTVDAIRKIQRDNPEHGSLIPGGAGTVWFEGCGCDFRTEDGTIVSADIRLSSSGNETHLELISKTEDLQYFSAVRLTDIVGDHVIHFRGEELVIQVPDPADRASGK